MAERLSGHDRIARVSAVYGVLASHSDLSMADPRGDLTRASVTTKFALSYQQLSLRIRGSLKFWVSHPKKGRSNHKHRTSSYVLLMGQLRKNQRGTRMTESNGSGQAYWRANIRLMMICLAIWAFVAFGLGIILRPLLMGISIGGADLGFWFAQQGSIYVFLALIFYYAIRMNVIDRKYGVEEE